MKIKKLSLAVALAATIGLAPSVHAAGIPVLDLDGLVQAKLQIDKMLEQIDQMKQQVSLATDELAAQTGVRDLANVIDSAYELKSSVDDFDVDDVLREAGLDDLSYEGLKGSALDLFKSKNRETAGYLAQSKRSLEQAQDRFNELTKLIAKVNDSPDPKDVMDLQARIGGEQVMLQNELVKLTMMKQQAEANNQMLEQRMTQDLIASSGRGKDMSDW